MSDDLFHADPFDSEAPPRNVILYGNEDTNAAFGRVLGGAAAGPAIRVRRGRVEIGPRALEGDDLACLFIAPRRGSRTASVGMVGGTGVAGLRATELSPYFVSGTGYPDWIVYGADMLRRGGAAIRGAGFFAHDWTLGESAWAAAIGADER